jgi:hypothetical protein
MSDVFGVLSLPAAAPGTGVAAGDPALTLVAAYLKAAVNRMAGTAWAAVCPGRLPIEHAFINDPVTQFDEERLPAVYLWRTEIDTEQFNDDTTRHTSQVALWWITEPAQNDHLVLREPVMNLMGAAISAALRKARDPAWVVAGDMEALAATQGSLVRAHAGLVSMTCGKVVPIGRALEFVDADGKPIPVPGLSTTLQLVEDLTLDPSIGATPSAVRVDLALVDPVEISDFAVGHFATPPET